MARRSALGPTWMVGRACALGFSTSLNLTLNSSGSVTAGFLHESIISQVGTAPPSLACSAQLLRITIQIVQAPHLSDEITLASVARMPNLYDLSDSCKSISSFCCVVADSY